MTMHVDMWTEPLREQFVTTARKVFDKLLKKEKRNFQLSQQKELFDLSN